MKIKMLLSASVGATCLLAVLLASGLSRGHAQDGGSYRATTGLSADRLRGPVDALFDPGDAPSPGETRALVLMRDGEVVAERYAPGFGPDSRFLSWSVGKTVTALLIGIMVSDGRLALDAPVPVAAWRQNGDPRGAITLREMLQMSSGLAHVENNGPPERSDTLHMLVGEGASDQAAFAEAKPLASSPGSRFVYSTATTTILCDMMTGLLTSSRNPAERRRAMTQFVRQRLMEPAGLASLTPEFDAHGTMLGGMMMHMTARDFARLGEMLRHRGRVNGHQIVPESWIDFMASPSPANAGYGGHLWLNRPGAEHNLFVGRASPRLFAAIGLRGQYVIISPAQDMTLVRLGVTTDAELPALRDALAHVIEQVPGG